MELSPLDRLKVHLALHHPNLKLRNIRLSKTPGFLHSSAHGLIDIRGAGYGSDNPPLRLWGELHDCFVDVVSVVKRKYGKPTLIEWNGMTYHLDQVRSYRNKKGRAMP